MEPISIKLDTAMPEVKEPEIHPLFFIHSVSYETLLEIHEIAQVYSDLAFKLENLGQGRGRQVSLALTKLQESFLFAARVIADVAERSQKQSDQK